MNSPAPQVGDLAGPLTDSAELARHLSAVLRYMRPAGREWVVILVVLLSTEPLTAKEVSRRARIAYPHSKEIIRRLIAWRMLQRHNGRVVFQPDTSRWGPPTVPLPTNSR